MAEWIIEQPVPDADPFAGYGPDRIVPADARGLDVEEDQPIPWGVVASLAARFRPGLGAMAGALRAEGWIVIAPPAPFVPPAYTVVLSVERGRLDEIGERLGDVGVLRAVVGPQETGR